MIKIEDFEIVYDSTAPDDLSDIVGAAERKYGHYVRASCRRSKVDEAGFLAPQGRVLRAGTGSVVLVLGKVPQDVADQWSAQGADVIVADTVEHAVALLSA